MGEVSRKLLAWLRTPTPRADPEPVNAKPERNMREEIMRRTTAAFGGPNHGDTGGPGSEPGSPEEQMDRYHRLRNS